MYPMYPETRDLADADERSQRKIKVRVELETGDDGACDIDGSIAALSEVYRKFYAWDAIVTQAELDSLEDGHSRETPVKQLSSYAAGVPAEDEPRVEKIHATSPVMVEITGVPGPLKRLQWYFENRRVHWDRQAKEPSEDRRLQLETQRTDAVREQVDLLHGLGFPEIQIRELLSQYISAPLDRLERCAEIKFCFAEGRQSMEKSAGETVAKSTGSS